MASEQISGEPVRAPIMDAEAALVPSVPTPNRRLNYEWKVLLWGMLVGVPSVLLALLLLWRSSLPTDVRWIFTVALLASWLALALALRGQVIRPLQTLSNIISALREHDYSFRGTGANRGDTLGELVFEINLLSWVLGQERTAEVEATALLRKVMAKIDVAVFTFDMKQTLRLVNRAGEELLATPAERMLGLNASQLGLEWLLQDDALVNVNFKFPGKEGRWYIQRNSFREAGVPHMLLMVSEVSRALRHEERLAWQRLIRVLGHELNNSLAPIKSVAGSLRQLSVRSALPGELGGDLARGLDLIEARADSLGRFMQGYTQIAKLPLPVTKRIEVGLIIARVCQLETRMPVKIVCGNPMYIEADPDQLEQLLINLVRNAVDASLETHGAVEVTWSAQQGTASILVRDEGPGIGNGANLFVPFFTTKSNGSGIGLVLSRQIAEAHNGRLLLKNRGTGCGCEAELQLPLAHS